MWNRRQFGKGSWVALSALGSGLELQAAALEDLPEDGFEYQRLERPAPQTTQTGIEVLKFFRYGCSFCDRFAPRVHEWRKQLPSDVRFHHVPVSFQSTAHQQLHLSLQQLGQAERLHLSIYDAIHRQGQHFEFFIEISDWLQQRGVDPKAFEKAWHSREVAHAMRQTNALVSAYGVSSVPQFGVAGRYRTSPTMAGGSNERALQVVMHLVVGARQA